MDVTTQWGSGSVMCIVTACEPADTRLEPEDEGTRLDFAFELSLPGKWRLMQPMISRAVSQAADADFATLRAKFAP
jgi:carbon monoxide dehydrogenase subunit G